MEHVPGDTLEAFALQSNPSSRRCVHVILDVARTLGEVHAAGVFHRDLKPSNILIREENERPVLIDFGISALGSAASLTETRIPPATPEFRAPEPLRFLRENTDPRAHYEYAPTDELWALGVTFYWLLTDVYPFGERMDAGGAEGLCERILTRRPVAPHLLNPRVPPTVSQVCMKMLAEWPAERYATVPELCSALHEALTRAEHDPAWDGPLMDPHDTQVITTLDDPEQQEPNEVLRLWRKNGKRLPRRGLVRPKKELDLLLAHLPEESPSAPNPRGAQDRIPGPSGTSPPPALPPRYTPRRLGLAVALAAVFVVGLSIIAAPWVTDSSSGTSTALPEVPRPSRMAGHEMAPAAKPLESSPGEGAVPVGAPPPAPTANTMEKRLQRNARGSASP